MSDFICNNCDAMQDTTDWIKSDTVVITYTDGSKETMSRTSFNQIIKG